MREGFIITEEGRKALEKNKVEDKRLSEAMGRLLYEVSLHPGEVSWSPIPAMRALQNKALALKLIEEGRLKMSKENLITNSNLIIEPHPRREFRMSDKGNLLEFWHDEELVAHFDDEGKFHCVNQKKLVEVLKDVAGNLRESIRLERELKLTELKAKYPWLYKGGEKDE